MEESKQIVSTNSDKKSKNTTLNFFEVLACIMIVFIHAEFPGVFGSVIVKGMARFGVPLFFTVSGYYLLKDNMTEGELRTKLKRRIKNTCILILFSFVIYFTLGIIQSAFGSNGVGVKEYLIQTFSIKHLLMLLILNYPLTNVPTWFLIAQLYSYVIIYLFAKQFIKHNWLTNVLSSLLLFWIIFRIVVSITQVEVFGVQLSNSIFYFSWYANGLLFISLGIVIKRNEAKLMNMPFKYWLITYIASFILMTFETYFWYKVFNVSTSYFIFNIINVISIMAISIHKPNLFSKSKFLNQKGNFKTYVYIFHPAIISVVNFVIKKIGIESNVVVSWCLPIIVLILAIGIASIFNKLVCTIKDRIDHADNVPAN